MTTSHWLALTAGLFFGIWPLVIKTSGLQPVSAAFILSGISAIVCLPFLKLGGGGSWTMGAVLLGVLAGLLNGAGTVAFQQAIASKLEISTVVFIILTLQVVITVLGGRVFYGDVFTPQKIAGIVAACVAMFLLTGK